LPAADHLQQEQPVPADGRRRPVDPAGAEQRQRADLPSGGDRRSRHDRPADRPVPAAAALLAQRPAARQHRELNPVRRTDVRHYRSRMAIALTGAAALTLLLGGASTALARSATPALARSAASAVAGGAATTAAPQPYLFVHDPTMAEEHGTYYVFSTGDPAGTIGNGNIQIRTSRDLKHWTYAGTVFAQKPSWITDALGAIPNLWASDISFFGGLWHLYYAGSSFGSNNSVIGLATTPTLDPRSPRYHWTDDGQVFRSGSADDFNAIDPSLVSTPTGGKWLAFGSFWSGIKLIQLDPATGKPASATPQVTALAEQPAP